MSKKINYIKNGDSYECCFKDEYKLVLHSPSIQSHNEYKVMSSEEDIMYYYYGIKLLHKDMIDYIENEDDDLDYTPVYKWKLIAKRNTHDFPNALSFKSILEYILKSNPEETGQKIELQDGDFRYIETHDTDNWAYDDYYSVTKVKNTYNDNIYYHLYIGVSKDSQGDRDTVGFRLELLEQDDIEELYKFVSDFIQYSIDLNNEDLEKSCLNKEIIDNQLITYVLDGRHNKLNKDKIDSIFIIGDSVDIRIKNSDERYDNFIINSFDEINQILTIKKNEKELTFKVSDICGIYDNVVRVYEYKLHYNLDEVAHDFYLIMTNNQKKEFQNPDINSLVNKYFMAIVDRTAMCRHEHGFTNKGIDGIKPYVEKVVEKLIEMCK